MRRELRFPRDPDRMLRRTHGPGRNLESHRMAAPLGAIQLPLRLHAIRTRHREVFGCGIHGFEREAIEILLPFPRFLARAAVLGRREWRALNVNERFTQAQCDGSLGDDVFRHRAGRKQGRKSRELLE